MIIIASFMYFCSSEVKNFSFILFYALQYASQKIFLLATCNDLYCYPLSV